MWLFSYSTRLLGVSQPSSSALQAAWHQAGLSGGTISLVMDSAVPEPPPSLIKRHKSKD